MKRFTRVIITILALGSVLTACSKEKEETKVETYSELDIINEDNEQDEEVINNEKKERMDRLEKEILIYGESIKGSYYWITVNTKFPDLNIQYTIKVDKPIKTAQFFYKYEGETEYKSIFLKDDSSDVYTYKIPGMEMAGKKNIEYYLKISDGQQPVTTDTQIIEIEPSDVKTSGLNLTEGSVLSGKVSVKSYGKNDKLMINLKDVTAQTTPVLPRDAYFVVEANKVDNFFKNAVTMGDKVLAIYDYRITQYKTLSVPISASKIQKGKTTTLSFHAGTKMSPFDEASTENRDDFTIRNVRLVINDGTIIYDSNYLGAEKELAVGDDRGSTKVYDFVFDIPDQYFSANEYEWDTTQLDDGTYTISTGKESIQVKIDNTAPTVTPTIQEGKEYKGKFTIDAEVTDTTTVSQIKATLDGEAITLPYEISSGMLNSGEHTLSIETQDNAGNTSVKTVVFSTTTEMPNAPEILSPVDGAVLEGTKADIKVKVTDPTDDHMKVQFYEGFKYLPKDDNIKAYANTSFTEPPKQVTSDSDQIIMEEEKISETDGEYLEISSTDQFPYHRFEVNIDESVDKNDELLIDWVGKSLEGRRISMYLWNYDANRWEIKDWHVAEDESNFKLQASIFTTEEYVKDNKVQAIIQDEIASSAAFDYSFVWMSDTQYYSESYPFIYDKMTSWISQEKENLNIQYVFHTGDLVDKSYMEDQWINADRSMKTLEDAGIPYGVLAGNHDVNHTENDYTKYYEYFGADRFKDETYYGESYKNNRGHYDILNVNGNEYLMIYMGWGVNDEDMVWINQVLEEHPNSIAILNFHEYLSITGQRSTIGNEIYEKVVKPNENVVAVLSGHFHDAEILVDEIDDDGNGITDRKVYQILADYQAGSEGGQGYLRLFKINQNSNKISVETYSPYLDKYNFYNADSCPGKDQFEMEIDLGPQKKLVATDSFKVQVYTDNLIDEVKNVKSGEIAQTSLKNLLKLKTNTKYGWYANIEDDFDGKNRSDVQLFTTGTKNRNSQGGALKVLMESTLNGTTIK